MKISNRLSAGLLAAFLGIAAAGCAHDRSLGEVSSDAAISTKVKAALLGDPDVAGTSITVETLRGTVQLSGFAKSAREAQRAVDLARRVEGVNRVIDNTTIAPR